MKHNKSLDMNQFKELKENIKKIHINTLNHCISAPLGLTCEGETIIIIIMNSWMHWGYEETVNINSFVQIEMKQKVLYGNCEYIWKFKSSTKTFNCAIFHKSIVLQFQYLANGNKRGLLAMCYRWETAIDLSHGSKAFPASDTIF